MMTTFLKAKHWQLFLLVFVLPFIIYIGWLISFFSGITGNQFYSNDFPVEMFSGITTMILLMMIPAAVQYGWFWSMAVGLQKKLPDGVTMKVNLFKLFFIIPLVFFLLYMLFLVSFLGSIERIEDLERLEDLEDFGNIGLIVLGIFMFTGLSMFMVFCAFYQFWFIAKTIKSAELQREVKFGEFVGEFFLVWFYPIGVWILQPTINKIVSADSTSQADIM